MLKVLKTVFFGLVGLYLVAGGVVVALQFAGVLVSNGSVVEWPYKWLAPMTFAAATIASLVAYVLSLGSGDSFEED